MFGVCSVFSDRQKELWGQTQHHQHITLLSLPFPFHREIPLAWVCLVKHTKHRQAKELCFRLQRYSCNSASHPLSSSSLEFLLEMLFSTAGITPLPFEVALSFVVLGLSSFYTEIGKQVQRRAAETIYPVILNFQCSRNHPGSFFKEANFPRDSDSAELGWGIGSSVSNRNLIPDDVPFSSIFQETRMFPL